MTSTAALSSRLVICCPEAVAGRLQGKLSASIHIEGNHLAIHVVQLPQGTTSKHPTFSNVSGTTNYSAHFLPERVRGYGVGIPQFRKTEVSAAMRDIDGVTTLVLTTPILSKLKRPVDRFRTKKADAPAPTPAPTEMNGSCSLRQLVAQVNGLKREMSDDLVLSIAADGTLRATVEYS